MRFRSRARSFSIRSRVRSAPLVSSFLLVFSSCRSASSSLPSSRSARRLARSSLRMRFSSSRLRCSRSILRRRGSSLERSSSSAPLREKTLAVDHHAFDARRAVERSVLHVAGLFAEDRAQQLLFRRQLRFALRRHLAHQNVARLDRGADADDAALVQVAQEALGDVRNVARDFLRTELGVAGLDFELFDVDRGVVVFLDQLLADDDGVLEVVAAPGHEGHQHVAAESQFAQIGARTVGEHVALLDPLALTSRSASG